MYGIVSMLKLFLYSIFGNKNRDKIMEMFSYLTTKLSQIDFL